MEKITKVKTIPANYSPESIGNVASIVFVVEDSGMGHIITDSISLEGTVEEKLAQYKAHTGKDWKGLDKQTLIIHEKVKESVSLGLGQTTPTRILLPIDIKVQENIDALTEKARLSIVENEEAKKQWVAQKEVEALTV